MRTLNIIYISGKFIKPYYEIAVVKQKHNISLIFRLFYLNQGHRTKNFYIYIDLFAVSHSVINRMINSGKKVSPQVSSSIIVNQTFCTRNVYIDNMIKSTYYIWNYFLSFSTNEYDHLLDYVNILGLKKLRIALINPNLFPTSYLFHPKSYIYIACLSNNLLMLSANWISPTTPFSFAVFFLPYLLIWQIFLWMDMILVIQRFYIY